MFKGVLRDLLKSTGRAVVTSLRSAACILGVAMLLSFPTARSLHFGPHFGTTEIRQNIVRHTFVAGPETGGLEKIARIDSLPSIPAPVITPNIAQSSFRLPLTSVPTLRILRHLKLGPPRSGSPDPLT